MSCGKVRWQNHLRFFFIMKKTVLSFYWFKKADVMCRCRICSYCLNFILNFFVRGKILKSIFEACSALICNLEYFKRKSGGLDRRKKNIINWSLKDAIAHTLSRYCLNSVLNFIIRVFKTFINECFVYICIVEYFKFPFKIFYRRKKNIIWV